MDTRACWDAIGTLGHIAGGHAQVMCYADGIHGVRCEAFAFEFEFDPHAFDGMSPWLGRPATLDDERKRLLEGDWPKGLDREKTARYRVCGTKEYVGMCSSCDGKGGLRTCPRCDGEGWISYRCSHCGRVEKLPCTLCGQEGEIGERYGDACPACFGTGLARARVRAGARWLLSHLVHTLCGTDWIWHVPDEPSQPIVVHSALECDGRPAVVVLLHGGKTDGKEDHEIAWEPMDAREDEAEDTL